MTFLHEFASQKNLPVENLNPAEIFSIYYHNIFNYPLTFSELIKWVPGKITNTTCEIEFKHGYYFVKGKRGLIYKRSIKKRLSQEKIKIAKRAAGVISLIPSIKFVGVSGSLAMENVEKDSDIDLILITASQRLWTSRVLAYTLLNLFGFSLRKPGSVKQNDRLCPNIWLDEKDLIWKKKERNFYTAHEILQIRPLVNKNKTYEKFIYKNKWALNFWPNAVDLPKLPKSKLRNSGKNGLFNSLEHLAYKAQIAYMKPKITKEVVSPTRAIFHPNNLAKRVLSQLNT